MMGQYVIWAVLIIAVLIGMVVFGHAYNDCAASGGQYVRGVFGYVCVKQ